MRLTILAVSPAHLRCLATLILETGMRSTGEALNLRWEDVDFDRSTIFVRRSKTVSGVRYVPMSIRCKAALLRWRAVVGAEYSPYVFPNSGAPNQPMNDLRRSWARALKNAGIDYFWIYNLRHTFVSRLSAAGVPDLFVAQMMGHSTPSILQTYARAIDDSRRGAIHKLETLRADDKAGHSAFRPQGNTL